LFQFKYLA